MSRSCSGEGGGHREDFLGTRRRNHRNKIARWDVRVLLSVMMSCTIPSKESMLHWFVVSTCVTSLPGKHAITDEPD